MTMGFRGGTDKGCLRRFVDRPASPVPALAVQLARPESSRGRGVTRSRDHPAREGTRLLDQVNEALDDLRNDAVTARWSIRQWLAGG